MCTHVHSHMLLLFFLFHVYCVCRARAIATLVEEDESIAHANVWHRHDDTAHQDHAEDEDDDAIEKDHTEVPSHLVHSLLLHERNAYDGAFVRVVPAEEIESASNNVANTDGTGFVDVDFACVCMFLCVFACVCVCVCVCVLTQ